MKKYIKYFGFILVLISSVFLVTGCDSDSSNVKYVPINDSETKKKDTFKNTNEEKEEIENIEDNITNSEEEILVCTRTATLSSNVKVDLRYEVTYKDGSVTYLKSTEKVISDSISYLETYKNQVENTYEPYKGIKYYDYEITIEDDTMTSSVSIDYSKIDTDKLISIDSANTTLIKNGKIDINSIKTLYESVGATCN